MADTDAQARQDLAEAMETRRDELGKSWREVAADGHLSYETVRAVRKLQGKGPIPAPTRRKLEHGLEWPTRHIDELLSGTAHGDLRPENVLLPRGEVVARVVDVGLAREAVDPREELRAEGPDLRDDVERDLWQLAMTRGLGERGALLLINAYRADQKQQQMSHELDQKQIG